ncbi:hypothetical protein JCM17092_26630 [Haloplanus litoreus]
MLPGRLEPRVRDDEPERHREEADEYESGVVGGDLTGLMLCSRRWYWSPVRYDGLDAIVERTTLVETYPLLTHRPG